MSYIKLVKSAHRALELLELLVSAPEGLSFTELLIETGLSKSTAHELLQTLLFLKYIRYAPESKKYLIGTQVLALGIQYLHHSPDMQKAVKLANELASMLNTTVSIGVRSGEHAVIVQQVGIADRSSEPTRIVGSELPLCSTALGKSLLCQGEEARHGDTKIGWELREVRSFGLSFEEEQGGIISLAIPLFNESGEVSAAISIELKRYEIDYARLKEVATVLLSLNSSKTARPIAQSSADDPSSHKRPIYVSLPNFHSQKALEYLHTFDRLFQLEGKPWILSGSSDHEWKQQLYLELAIAHLKPACMIISPVNTVKSDILFRTAAQAAIPAICFQRPSRSRFVDYYVGGDGYEQGVQQMRYVADRLKGRGTVLLLEGDPYNDNAHNISYGHQTVLEQYSGRIQAITIPVMLWSKEETKQIVAETLASGTKLDAIVAGSDQMAEGAIEVLEPMKLAGKIMVVGGDGDLSAVRLIKARKQHATVFQRPIEAATAAVHTALALARGQIIEGTKQRTLLRDVPGKEVHVLSIPYTFYDQSNVEELDKYWQTHNIHS